MKRTPVIIGMLAAGALALAGCSGTADAPKDGDGRPTTTEGTDGPAAESVEIELWIGDRVSQAGMEATVDAVAQWEEETGHRVNVVENSFFELMNKIPVAVPAGDGPDAFMLTNNYVGQFLAQDLIEPIEIDPALIDGFLPDAVSSMTLEGELLAVPVVADVNALVYNTELLPEVPATFDELVDVAKGMTAGDEYGLLFPVDQFWFSFPFLAGEGAYIFGESGGEIDVNDLGFSNAGAIAGLERVAELVSVDQLMAPDTTADIAQGLFAAGKAAAIIDGPAVISTFEDAGISVGVAPLPPFASGAAPMPFATYTGFSVSSETQHPVETAALLAYLGEVLPQALQDASPGNISAQTDADAGDNAQLAGWLAQLARSYPLPSVPEMNLVWGPAIAAVTQVVHGQATAPAALGEAEAAIREAIEAQ